MPDVFPDKQGTKPARAFERMDEAAKYQEQKNKRETGRYKKIPLHCTDSLLKYMRASQMVHIFLQCFIFNTSL